MRLLHLYFLPLTALSLFAQTATPPAPSSASSQQSTSAGYAGPLFNATTRNVVLDAVVTDNKGNVITGLTRNDFRVREDGAPQQVLSFDAIAAGTGSAEARPHTILLVDEMNTRFEDMGYVRYSIDKLLRHGPQLDQPTALYILGNDGLHILQDYTLDPAAIEQALRQHKSVLPWRLDTGYDGAQDRIDRSLTAAQQIAIANGGVPGHKNIVWISPGFPIASTLQLDAKGQEELFDVLRRLSDQLLTSRFSVYSVDPRGVIANDVTVTRASTNMQFSAYLNSMSAANQVTFGDLAIQTLAQQTGGHSFSGRNDVDREIAAGISEGNTYYTLSYSPANRNFDGKYRTIKVTVNDRPGYTIHAREGYYAIPDGQPISPERRMQELISSLYMPLAYTGIPILTATSRMDHEQVSVRCLVPTSALTWTPDTQGHLKASISVAAADQDKHGHWQQSVGRVYTLSLPDGKAPSPTLSTNVSFDLPYHHATRVRFVVRDDTSGRIGSSEIKLDPSRTS
jgi:VWFA-related protein